MPNKIAIPSAPTQEPHPGTVYPMNRKCKPFGFRILFLSLATPCFIPTTSSATEIAAPFADEIHNFSVDDEIYTPPPCAVLFVGSSSIRFWTKIESDFPKLRIIRRGYGGSTIADANFYFERIVSRYLPEKIVFYAGENDINGGATPEAVFSEFQRFMELKTRALGATPVYFVSIKPSKARTNDFAAQTAANALVSACAESRADLVFVNVASPMMENGAPKNIFISDNLHINAQGYAIWKKEIGRALRKADASKSPNCRD